MKRTLLFLVLMASPAWAADDSAAMAGAVNGFLAAYQAFPGGIPDSAARARFAPYVSPGLLQSLSAAEAAEKRGSTKGKAMPPLIEGDIFTAFVEGASNSRLGPCMGDTQRGTCKVSYVHSGKSNLPGPLAWTDTLLMVNTPSGWRVDDVAYDPGFAFGNSGRLSQTLAMIRSEAR